MGRKVHPIGFRLGINQPWGGRWFAEGAQYRQQLHQDFAIRNLLIGKFSKGGAAADEKVRGLRKQMPDAVKDGKAGISRIDVERTPGKVRISIHTAKPGILIGRKGEGVKKIRQALETLVGKKVELDIKEISLMSNSIFFPTNDSSDWRIFLTPSPLRPIKMPGLAV